MLKIVNDFQEEIFESSEKPDLNPLDEYIHHYGTKSLNLVIAEFINRSPPFAGRDELALHIEERLEALESGLKHYVATVNKNS